MSRTASVKSASVCRQSRSDGGAGSEIRLAAAKLDPVLAGEMLTTENLTAVIYGNLFGEPHIDNALCQVIRDVAEIAGGGITRAVTAAARAASKKGFIGVSGVLADNVQVQANWQAPTVYVELRRNEAYLVLRIEDHPKKKGVKFSFIHEIQAEAQAAIEIMTVLACSWEALGTDYAMKTSRGRLVSDAISSSARVPARTSRASALA